MSFSIPVLASWYCLLNRFQTQHTEPLVPRVEVLIDSQGVEMAFVKVADMQRMQQTDDLVGKISSKALQLRMCADWD